MRPAFQITSNGSDMTRVYAERLRSLTITDEATEQADTLTIELVNADNKIKLPQDGETLQVAIGYIGALQKMGSYIVDEVSIQGPPDYITLSAKAAPFTAAGGLKPLQSRKTRSFSDLTFGELAQLLAAESGLSPAISPDLASVQLRQVDQTAESNMNLLTRLSRQLGAVMKPTFGKLVLVKRGDSKSVSGKDVGGVTITRQECSLYSAKIGRRTKVKKVVTSYHDAETGEEELLESIDQDGESDGVSAEYEHPFPFSDELEAAEAADSIRDQLARGAQTVSVTLPGRPDLVAEGSVNLSGFPPGMDGTWLVKRVVHQFDANGGFTTTLEGENSKARALDQATQRKQEDDSFEESDE